MNYKLSEKITGMIRQDPENSHEMVPVLSFILKKHENTGHGQNVK